MRLVCLVFLSCLLFACDPAPANSDDALNQSLQVEKMTESYENGRPKVIAKIQGGQVIFERHYYDTGGVMKEGPIKANQKSDYWKAYYPSGKIQSTGFFKDGKRTGKVETFYENGNLRYEGEFKNGKKFGKWVFYDEAGNVTRTEKY